MALAGCGASTLPEVHSEPERLAMAKRMMDRHKYNSAVELLKTYIADNPGSGDVDEAIDLLGESYLAIKSWVEAQNEFERLLRDYPESDSSASASFHLGEALFGEARPPDFDQEFSYKALDQWQRYLQSYPGHWLNPEAEKRIGVIRRRLAKKHLATADLYMKLHLTEPARVYYEKVLNEYGDTELRGEALMGLARCDERWGNRQEAVNRLRTIEEEFRGQPIAARAAQLRSRIDRP